MTAHEANSAKLPRALLHPRWWLAWLLLGIGRALCWLPVSWLLAIGSSLGWLVWRLLPSRRRVTRINLRLCFPEFDEARIVDLVEAHFRALGMGLFETLLAWLAPDAKLKGRLELRGVEHLDAAAADGSGVLLLTGHFTTLEIAARSICLADRPFHAMYRPADNAFVDWWMHRWREQRSGRPALPKDDLKNLLRALRNGGAVWYAPDQTLEVPGAIFVPFFGVPALTLTATSRLAQLGRAKVVPFFPARGEDGRYVVTMGPALDNFPSGDDQADTRRINALIEDAIRICPEQYFWTHRRFKFQPPGAPDVYARG
ncbi:LpxL/LpxP family Kdo(2)-lipid IV(A) lauroyl/palmitoleoyl acyltransferase [Nevskia sp.]|uniref:LpxL/LpxP family Kdo(2)-lipid IV(A) lauroyl/palmitoleoyl acyltransferase n=1 Tax=Nevskia sp. TaxID=1929292 RepID=UPI0025DF7490|nr:LpxL/LpxP family Kdo(2)-lipid IV(A) lauroyl/palmitoleoyl acyltransferase [Nevskia sp.]